MTADEEEENKIREGRHLSRVTVSSAENGD